MSATIVILPVTRPDIFQIVSRAAVDPALREQRQRELLARIGAMALPPPRTRPLLVVDNTRRAEVQPPCDVG